MALPHVLFISANGSTTHLVSQTKNLERHPWFCPVFVSTYWPTNNPCTFYLHIYHWIHPYVSFSLMANILVQKLLDGYDHHHVKIPRSLLFTFNPFSTPGNNLASDPFSHFSFIHSFSYSARSLSLSSFPSLRAFGYSIHLAWNVFSLTSS